MTVRSAIDVGEVNRERLAQVIRQAGRPVHLNLLARQAVRHWLEAQASGREYVPGARYEPGETIRFDGQPAQVTAVEPGSNPKQGQFQIVTLVLP